MKWSNITQSLKSMDFRVLQPIFTKQKKKLDTLVETQL